jgi:hypothetical protein
MIAAKTGRPCGEFSIAMPAMSGPRSAPIPGDGEQRIDAEQFRVLVSLAEHGDRSRIDAYEGPSPQEKQGVGKPRMQEGEGPCKRPERRYGRKDNQQPPAIHSVAKPADGQLQQDRADKEYSQQERRRMLRPSEADGIERQ